MLEKLLPNIYRIAVPLPEHPLRTVNSYIITSKERNLVIDTGWNRLESAEELLNGLDEIGIPLSRTDLFLTHIHADHAGLTRLFKHRGTTLFCGREDLARMDHYLNISQDKSWKLLHDLARPHGFPMGEIEAALAIHPGNRYAPAADSTFTAISNKDVIRVGDYNFFCIATPGHTPGHMCLYEPSLKILFSGDHLLGEFSPTISQWDLSDRFVENYLASFDNLAEYDVDMVLPGHWDTFRNFHFRIKDTKTYHQFHQAEIVRLFADGKTMTAYQAASCISHNNKNHEWPFVPLSRKWALVADTIAQLCYLRDQGTLTMIRSQDQVLWQK